MGSDPDASQCLQALVPGGTLFGATVECGEGYSLVGCTCVPGFDFADFEVRRGQDFWRHVQTMAPTWDAMIDEFNGRAGVPATD